MKYKLYDLEITTVGDPSTYNCSHVHGDQLLVRGENIAFGPNTTQFSHYALATLMPYIAAKQRASDDKDWMAVEADIACPDPLCGARFHFKRLKLTTYEYSPRV